IGSERSRERAGGSSKLLCPDGEGAFRGRGGGEVATGRGEIPENIIHEVAMGIQEVGTPEGEHPGFHPESLVEQVRHGTADRVVLQELRGVLGLEGTLLQRVGDDRENASSRGQLTGNPEPGKYARIDVGSTKSHTTPSVPEGLSTCALGAFTGTSGSGITSLKRPSEGSTSGVMSYVLCGSHRSVLLVFTSRYPM